MKRVAFIVMAAWLLLWGCDDDRPTGRVSTDMNGPDATVRWDEPGCSSDTGTLDVEGERGKVRIDWDYVPAAVVTIACLAFVTVTARHA